MRIRRGRKIKPQLMATVYSQLSDLLAQRRAAVAIARGAQESNVARGVGRSVGRRAFVGGKTALRWPTPCKPTRGLRRNGREHDSRRRRRWLLGRCAVRVASFTEQQQDLKGRTSRCFGLPNLFGCRWSFRGDHTHRLLCAQVRRVVCSARKARGELPPITEYLLAVSHTMAKWILPLIVVIVGIILYIRNYLQTEEGKFARDRLQIRLPMVGGIFKNLAVARFCRVLGTLLHNGVPILPYPSKLLVRPPAIACWARPLPRRPKTFPPGNRSPNRWPPQAISRPKWSK